MEVDLEDGIAAHGREKATQAFGSGSYQPGFTSLDEYLASWPIRHVHAGLPPFLFLIAEAEQEHPPVLETDAKFVEEAKRLGNDAAYCVLPGRTHYSAIRKLGETGDAVFAIVRESSGNGVSRPAQAKERPSSLGTKPGKW